MAYDATSAKGCEGDRLEDNTLEETFLQETTASAATPKQKPSCAEQDITVDHYEPLAIDDGCVSFNFNDGMGIAIGQEFASKNEVKNLVINASLKTCFDFHIVKSITSISTVGTSANLVVLTGFTNREDRSNHVAVGRKSNNKK